MRPTPPRVTTGIPGLDPILEGGLIAGGTYMLVGPPGSGKTILANQLCCHQARQGGSAVYFTLLTESHSSMFEHLRRMAFFTERVIGDAVLYFSGYKVLEDEGVAGLGRMIAKVMTERRPRVVVLDGFATVGDVADSKNSIRELVRQLQAASASMGCATVLLSSAGVEAPVEPEQTIVDGILVLTHRLNGQRTLRHLEVRKLRGSRPITGRHSVELTDAGMAVHARFEAGSDNLAPAERPRPSARVRHGHARAAFGIAELDAMMHGGPLVASTTMLLGCSGVGKTTLALHFLAAGVAAGEPGLFFGMYEQPEDLLDKAAQLGIPLRDGLAAGTLELLWERPIEGVLDVLADRLLARVRALGAKRLVIDGLQSLFRTVDFPERMRAVSAALTEAFTALGVTAVYTMETPELIGAERIPLTLPIDDLSSMCQNLITLRLIERDGRYDRILAILKMRDSDYDRRVRELTITPAGAVVAGG